MGTLRYCTDIYGNPGDETLFSDFGELKTEIEDMFPGEELRECSDGSVINQDGITVAVPA